MKKDKDLKSKILKKYLDNSITKQEYELLSEWISNDKLNNLEDILDEHIQKSNLLTREDIAFNESSVLEQINKKINHRKAVGHKRHWIQYAAVAVLLIICGFLFVSNPLFKNNGLLAFSDQYDIPMLKNRGGNLTFENGEVLYLDTLKLNTIHHDDINFKLLSGGGILLSSTESTNKKTTKQKYWTDAGSKGNIILEDGTSVWLSSSSSLVFPSKFSTDHRTVEISGEAYFNVKHDNKRPFIVKSKDSEIKVLGTEFNVRAYPELEFSKTTLISGSVNVKSLTKEAKINPGEQVVVQHTGQMQVDKANIEDAVSWQTNVYRFSNQTVDDILNELKRWYAIEGVDNKSLSKERYTGSLSKTNKLSDILKQLEFISSNRFIFKERRIVILDRL